MNAGIAESILGAIATLIERGEFDAAERRAQDTLLTLPSHSEVWRLLGIAQLQASKLEEAERSLQQARRLDPDSVAVLCNLASVQLQRGQWAEARQILEKALRLAPQHAGVLTNLGRLRHQIGDYEGAAECFERSIRAQPGAASPWLDLANTRIAQHRWEMAEDNLRYALSLQPAAANGWYLLGYLHERRGQLVAALQPYTKSLELAPRPQTAHNLALVFDQMGNWPAAARMLERALELDPNLSETLSQLVFIKRRLCEWDGLPALASRLLAGLDAGRDGILPFSLLVEAASPEQQLRCARRFARQFAANATEPRIPTALPVPANESAKIRVGFVSSGFAQHATGLLLVELIERLRASNLTTLAFSTSPDDQSEIRRRLVAGFHEFHDVSGRPADAIANTIRQAQCHILIDIDGYCMGSMPQIFALRPAPIQINFLAYPGSLGAPWYDYLLADAYVIQEDSRTAYDERIVPLPGCYQPTDTTRIVGNPPPRSDCGLPVSGFVYACFNASWKITPESFALWMRILQAVRGSVLWLLDGPEGSGIAGRLRAAALSAGMDPQRLIFSRKLEHGQYLARYRHADLFLDTSPYNAHTTASDALYAGCPVLTRPGDTFASRVAGSLNHRLELHDLIVDSDETYVSRAIELAGDARQLGNMRSRLADPDVRARLFDMQAYVQDFARALTNIARDHGRSVLR